MYGPATSSRPNLYVNRGITETLAGAQPFGSFVLSSTDSKAGSPDSACRCTCSPAHVGERF